MKSRLLREFFLRLLHTRGIARHFRRLAVLESFAGSTVSREVPEGLARLLAGAAQTGPADLLRELRSQPDGLSAGRARVIRRQVGPNAVDHEKPLPWWAHLWRCYRNPFSLLLTGLAAISYLTEDVKGAVVIAAMVALSTLLRFVQESRSSKAADRLKEMVGNTATVIRPEPSLPAGRSHGEAGPHPGTVRMEIPIRDLVPGDIVLLSAGDLIPADLRVLSAKDLFVSQAAMTGESLPVEKFASLGAGQSPGTLELSNILFMGTNVVSGSATAVVVTTGNRTYFGALVQRVTATDRAPTSFQAGVNQVSWLLIRFMAVMTPVVLLLNGFTKGDWLEAFLFALSIAVGMTPEMLPMIVTSTLAKGAVMLQRKKVIVKRLDAIQNFGAMDVLCTDKTGTLTQDRIVLERHIDAFGAGSDRVIELAFLNSRHQTGLKNPLDVAVLQHVEQHGGLDVSAEFSKVDEIPFDFQRRRMSVVVRERDHRHLLICKGAFEEVVSVCGHVRRGDAIDPLTDEVLSHVRDVTGSLNELGLRVVAVAVKEMGPERDVYGVADESGLTLEGYIAFLDPPKESSAPAIAALRGHGVAVKILTGDNERVTAKVCRDVGMPVSELVLGRDVDAMDDARLGEAVERASVFARLTPANKERIVRALKAKGHVVGFMGDGINDAPALHAADIGISVDTAVDIAKESADIILLKKSLLVLDEGVVEGRRTFANMLKYIRMTTSSNFGNVLSVLLASAFLPFLPMLPMHLLVQNLLYDISQVAIPFDDVDKELLERPERWRPEDIGRFMLFFGPVSSVFDILTYALMWFWFQANTVDAQTLFQSGWFVEGLLSQALIVHMIRTRHVPFFESRPSWPLLATTIAIVAIGIFLPMGPMAPYFKLQALPLSYFGFLVVMLLGYAALAQAMKGFYARRFGWQ